MLTAALVVQSMEPSGASGGQGRCPVPTQPMLKTRTAGPRLMNLSWFSAVFGQYGLGGA